MPRSIFQRPFSAFLFDMDGTLLDSIDHSTQVWQSWADSRGVPSLDFLREAHGMRVADVIAGLRLPGIDADEEAETIMRAEMELAASVKEIRGAKGFLDLLPRDRWAIVTSAPVTLARLRLQAAGLPLPDVLISASDITLGKPNPEPYLLAAERLGVDASDCLVFEDTPVGVEAANAAGAEVLAVTSAHATPFSLDVSSIVDYLTLRVEADQASLGWWVVNDLPP